MKVPGGTFPFVIGVEKTRAGNTGWHTVQRLRTFSDHNTRELTVLAISFCDLRSNFIDIELNLGNQNHIRCDFSLHSVWTVSYTHLTLPTTPYV